MIEVEPSHVSYGYALAKRAFDVSAALIGLVATAPISVAIAAAVLLESGPPVLYKGARVGRSGREFHILKFRSMAATDDVTGLGITVAGDRRVTPVGQLLRRTKLDEIPQLFNVLAGDMSLVGPRPEDPRYVRHYSIEQRRLLEVRPGITSVASLRYRHEEELLTAPGAESQYEAILADKLRLDLEYLARATFWSDLRLIVSTLFGLNA